MKDRIIGWNNITPNNPPISPITFLKPPNREEHGMKTAILMVWRDFGTVKGLIIPLFSGQDGPASKRNLTFNLLDPNQIRLTLCYTDYFAKHF